MTSNGSDVGGPPLDSFVRVRLGIAYDGTDFSGWASQPQRRTVQDTVESALATILRCPIRLTVAGRTDAGVHALGQVAHFDAPAHLWEEQSGKLIRRMAGVLPPDVRVHDAHISPDGFDARFSALWRRYRYQLSDADAGVSPLRRVDTVAWPRRLDVDAMSLAAAPLLGEHDFAAFCRHREGATTVRGLQSLDISRNGSLITIGARADAFCHSMVRSLVGALTAVGEGRRDPSWPSSLLTLTERSSAVPVVPAHGLTLVEVGYPSDPAQLIIRADVTRNVRTLPTPNLR